MKNQKILLLLLGASLLLGAVSCSHAASIDVSYEDGSLTEGASYASADFDAAYALTFTPTPDVFALELLTSDGGTAYAVYGLHEDGPCPALKAGTHRVPLLTLSPGDTYLSWLCSNGNDPMTHRISSIRQPASVPMLM
jgi:hypothetical protein